MNRKKLVVIPDLHGEVNALHKIIHAYSPEDHLYVFLGDVVDRGESSFWAWNLVYSLIQEHNMVGVRSNHDKKFYRWLTKYGNPEYRLPNLGMQLGHGLQKTVDEFLSLPDDLKKFYREGFIRYYEDLPCYLKIDNRYFVHAGIHNSALKEGVNIKALESDCVYRVSDHDTLSKMFGDDETFVHVGHIVEERDVGKIRTHRVTDSVQIIQHDVGLGKFISHNEFDPESMIMVIDR